MTSDAVLWNWKCKANKFGADGHVTSAEGISLAGALRLSSDDELPT
jgi:hypothetical protein